MYLCSIGNNFVFELIDHGLYEFYNLQKFIRLLQSLFVYLQLNNFRL